MSVRITVVGSINLDIVGTGPALPAPGETVTGAVLAKHPGGKGANQALAARLLGAEVALIGRVGADDMAREALVLLERDGVDLSGVTTDPAALTGVGLIAVAASGENQIMVCAGANATLRPEMLPETIADALILQLEIPFDTIEAAAMRAAGLVVLNLAPAAPVSEALLKRADVIVVNEAEAAFYGEALDQAGGLVAKTLGARGAKLFRDGVEIASAAAPKVTAVDTTGAGDTFVGALTVALMEGMDHAAALAFACAAGSLTATRAGAQSSLPWRAEVEGITNGA